MRRLGTIWRLGIKELYSLRRDAVLLALIAWSFTASIYAAATGISHELRHAAVAVVDDDRSPLSLRLRDALLPPQFKPPAALAFGAIDAAMDTGRYTFVLVIPPRFEADVLAGRTPELQLAIDATAIMQAGIGQTHIQSILAQEIARFVGDAGGATALPVILRPRYAFNPNVETAWFTSIMELVNNVTMLTVVLAGAALIREREHGTIEHLLVMPVTPLDIMVAKVWANAAVILVAVALSLTVVIGGLLAVPVAGSIPLFLAGTLLYLFFAAALGIFLATLARTMPQFGLLFILVFLPMVMLSGGNTPIESQPQALRAIMQAVPSSHFVAFAQAILYRGVGLDDAWPRFAAVTGIGALFFALAAVRFRRALGAAGR